MSGFVRWMPWFLSVAVGTFLGTGTYTFYYAKGFSYLSHEPRACINCHVMQAHFDSWVKSSHRAVATCNDCHVPHTFPEKYWVKMRNGWNHSKAFTLQNFAEPIRITHRNLLALQHNCVDCHGALTSEIASHREIEYEEIGCTSCHRSVGHMTL